MELGHKCKFGFNALIKYYAQSDLIGTTWEVSVFGVVLIFPHLE